MTHLRLAVLLAAAALLESCAPAVVAEAPNGDHTVTSYSRLFGLKETSLENREAALDACGADRPIVFDEKIGSDPNGLYRRWTFGCAAP